MRTIFAEYNPQRNSIDVYTSAGYMPRIDCWEAEKNLITTPGSECALTSLAVDEPLEYVKLYLDGNFPINPSAEFFLPALVQTSLQPLLPEQYLDRYDTGNTNQYDLSASVTMIVPQIYG